ncbi:MAG: ribosomal subunit interface protein [Gemmatimonadaceae bacterium]
MQIEISTDRNIEGNENLVSATTDSVAHALRRFSDQITRVEVHLADENGPKGGQNDIRCMLEVRIEGRQPIAVTHHAATIPLAVDGASSSLVSLIENTLGRTEALRRAQRS